MPLKNSSTGDQVNAFCSDILRRIQADHASAIDGVDKIMVWVNSIVPLTSRSTDFNMIDRVEQAFSDSTVLLASTDFVGLKQCLQTLAQYGHITCDCRDVYSINASLFELMDSLAPERP